MVSPPARARRRHQFVARQRRSCGAREQQQQQGDKEDLKPHPPISFFSIMQWMPLLPSTVCVTCRSACRLHSM